MCCEIKCLVSYVQIQNATNCKYHHYYKDMTRFLYIAFTLSYIKQIMLYYICDFSSENIPHVCKSHLETSIPFIHLRANILG